MIRDYYCFDISFPKIDFDILHNGIHKVKLKHHAHLFSRENEIELKIFFEPKTNFGKKLMIWASRINWRKFGSYIEISNESQNDRIQKIDLSTSELLWIKNGDDQIELKLQFVSVRINSLKIHWNPNPEKVGTAEFYFNDTGFKVVKGFYAPLFGWEGEFKISRMDQMEEFYKIEKAEFRPEFSFYYSDDRNTPEVKIIKEPKIQFKYNDQVEEEDALKYAKTVLLLASFYFHMPVEFTVYRIHFKENTIVFKKLATNGTTESQGGVGAFNLNWSFHEFMKANWQESTLKNLKKLEVVVKLFNQSLLVEGSSRFLIRFNIIELCMGGEKTNKIKFKSPLSQKKKIEKYNFALTTLLKTVYPNDEESFINKWNGIIKKLDYKPMDSPFEEYLTKEGLPIEKFPIKIKELKKMRDYLIHGSINSIKPDQLEMANYLLYRITGILILNLIGIKSWKFNPDF